LTNNSVVKCITSNMLVFGVFLQYT